MKMLLFIINGVCLITLFAQAPDTAWTKTYDGGGSEECRWIEETSDGGFVLVGISQISGNLWMDIFLVRTDSNGDTIWTRKYGDNIINQDAYCVKEDYDGGFVIAGIKHFTSVLRNAWIIKTDSSGDTLWTKKYGGDTNTEAINIWCTSDSGYIVTGKKFDPGQFSNAYLLKLDKEGKTEWTRTFGGSGYEEGYCVEQTSDGGFMLAGSKDVSGRGWDFYMIKTDTSGFLEWSETYGGNLYDHCTSAQQTSDGGYIMFGQTDSFVPNSGLAVKTNAEGDTLWTRIYSRSNGDYGWSVDETTDGGYIFGGYTNNPGYRDDYWFVKTDENGDSLWMKSVGHGEDQRGYCIFQASDGDYVFAGTSREDSPTYDDFYVVKLKELATGIDDNEVEPHVFTLNQNYPNPFNPTTIINYTVPNVVDAFNASATKISLKVYDVLGNEIITLVNEQKPPGNYSIEFDANNLTSGIYFYKLSVGEFSETKKMVLIR